MMAGYVRYTVPRHVFIMLSTLFILIQNRLLKCTLMSECVVIRGQVCCRWGNLSRITV